MAHEFGVRLHLDGSSRFADARNRFVSVRRGMTADYQILDALEIADLPALTSEGFLSSASAE